MVMNEPHGAEVELRFRTSEQGGRSTPLLIDSGTYRPHFVVPGGDYLGVVVTRGPKEPIAPGGSASVVVRFPYDVSYDALAEGATFDVMEGPHLVAEGRVLRRF